LKSLKIYSFSAVRASGQAGSAPRIALAIREPPDVKPPPTFKARAQLQLMEQIDGRGAVTKQHGFRYNS